jgi:hypothetical protein
VLSKSNASTFATGKICDTVKLRNCPFWGKAVAALTALKRALTASGLDHHALAAVIERGLSALSIIPPVQRTTDDWRSTASFCRAHRGDLTEREAIFTDNLLASYRTLTPKQEKWLYDIEAKLRGRR